MNILVAGVATIKVGPLKARLPQILLLVAALPVFLFNWHYSHSHLLAVFGLYLVLLLLLPEIIPENSIFIWLAWSAMIATLFSIYQFWSTAYGVVPGWLELAHHSNRMAGILGQANLMACLIVVGLFSWLQALWQRFGHTGWRWFYQIPVVIFFWALLLTGSKAGMLALLSALLLLGWGLSRAGERKLLKFLTVQFVWSLSLGALLFVLLQPPGIEIISDRTIDFTEQSASTGARLIFGGSALGMGLDHLWSGVGLGGYRRVLGSYMVPVAEWLRIPYDSISTTLWAHNDFLHVFAECGLLVALLLIAVYAWVLLRLWPSRNQQSLFLFCALWAFLVFMQFGHPFNDHVLVFYLLLMTAGSMPFFSSSFTLQVPKKLFLIVLLPAVIFINFQVLDYAYDMHNLKKYLKDIVESRPLDTDRLVSLRQLHAYDDLLKDTLIGWKFRYVHLGDLGKRAVTQSNRQLAAYLIPEFEKFKSEHFSASLNYQLSRLYFLVGRYAISKRTADEAFLLKPDMYHYSNFGHIALVFDISRREKKPVDQLLGKDYFLELQENKVFSMDMLDDNLCAL